MKVTLVTLTIMATAAVAAPAVEAGARCERLEQFAWKAKRAAHAFANSIANSGGHQTRSPDAELSNLPGGAAFKAKRVIDELAYLVSLLKDDAEDFYNGLYLETHFEPGSDAYETRDALPTPWCERPDQSCWKRDAEANPDAEAEAWCERPGQSCWKAKRELQAIRIAVRGILEALGYVSLLP